MILVPCILFIAVLTALAIPLGSLIARLLEPQVPERLPRWERGLYRVAGVDPAREMDWKQYSAAVLVFSFLSFVVVYLLQRLQWYLPLNPQGFAGATPHLSFNTAVSFSTNTNWQSYGGETTFGHLVQMLGLTVQNFVSAAAGIAVLVALARGFARRESKTIGNFWVDLTRATSYVLLPLSLVVAVLLASQGVVQTFTGTVTVPLLDPVVAADGSEVKEQVIAVGPAASQVAIKQLGTNGGGFFNVNSAHPLENPTPFSNFVEVLSILLIGGALCFSFGRWVGDKRQGRALYAAMLVLFTATLAVTVWAENRTPPAQEQAHAIPGPNLEGKEVRFGATESAIRATATTAASNGSVNSMHDSFTPIGGLIPMWLMQLGEVVFGGVGSGLYGMLVFAILAVFIAGLMVGRTPEYLGKKIEAFEVKMAALAVLFPAAAVLVGTAIAVSIPSAAASAPNPGAHGFSEILYAFSSAGNNNGSAFAGLSANVPFWNVALGLAMLVARFWVILPVLAIAGSLASKKKLEAGAGTFPTHGPLFVGLLCGTVLLVGALTFLPALALGPIAEEMTMIGVTR